MSKKSETYTYNTANDSKTHNDLPFMYYLNESGTEANPFPAVGVTIYKSFEYQYASNSGKIVQFGNHIKYAVETNAGAHYYVRSRYSDSYNSVSCKVDLSKISVLNQQRNAFICLGVICDGAVMKQCDFGIAKFHNKDYWTSFQYSAKWPLSSGKANNPKEFEDDSFKEAFEHTALSGVVTITITNESTAETDILKCTVSDASTSKTITYEAVAGQFFVRNSLGKPCLRFMRFISLVPQSEELDDVDYSELTAYMYDFQMNNADWSATDIEHVWSVQGANIVGLKIANITQTNGSYDTEDRIEIQHRYQLI